MRTPAVERPVVIGVLGSHSTGKSTFLARLAHLLRRQDLSVATVADLGEQAQRRGLPLLFNHTWASTMWIITRGISDEIEAWLHADVVLVDRAVPDALGYYTAALEYRGEEADPVILEHLSALVERHSHYYDLLFRTTLDRATPVGTAKVRDQDIRFRALADEHIGAVLRKLQIPHRILGASGHDECLTYAAGFAASKISDGVALPLCPPRSHESSADSP